MTTPPTKPTTLEERLEDLATFALQTHGTSDWADVLHFFQRAAAMALEEVHEMLGREPDFYTRDLDKIDDGIRALVAELKGGG